MKDYLAVMLGAVVVVFVGTFAALHTKSTTSKFGDFGQPSYFTSPTQATSSVGIYSPVNLITNAGSVTYREVCNTSPTSTNDLILELDATSSAVGLSAPGILVPGNSCYKFSGFTGNVYGLFTTNTATVSSLYK